MQAAGTNTNCNKSSTHSEAVNPQPRIDIDTRTRSIEGLTNCGQQVAHELPDCSPPAPQLSHEKRTTQLRLHHECSSRTFASLLQNTSPHYSLFSRRTDASTNVVFLQFSTPRPAMPSISVSAAVVNLGRARQKHSPSSRLDYFLRSPVMTSLLVPWSLGPLGPLAACGPRQLGS